MPNKYDFKNIKMKNYFNLFLIILITSCSSTRKTKTYKDNRQLKTGDIMEMNSEAFLVQNNTWSLISTEHFKFFFDKAISENSKNEIAKIQELNYNKIVQLMGLNSIAMPKINFWLFKDIGQKKKLTLISSDAHVISTYPSVYYLPKNAKGAQEVGHAITQSVWGFIPKRSNYALLIDEGFNYYIDNGQFYKEEIIERVKSIHSKESVNILKLVNANNGNRLIGVSTGSHEVNESLISGAFVQFLIEKYGPIKFGQLWIKATEKENAESIIFDKIYDKTLEELNNEFKNILA